MNLSFTGNVFEKCKITVQYELDAITCPLFTGNIFEKCEITAQYELGATTCALLKLYDSGTH